MTKYYVPDTNVFLNYIEVIDKYPIVVSSHVLRELEKIESNEEKYGGRSYKAREARRRIKAHENKIHIILKDYNWKMDNDFDSFYEDNKILQCCIDNNYGILTIDGLLAEKAQTYGVEWKDVEKELSIEENDYSGYKEVHMTKEQLDDFYDGVAKNTFGLLVNEYLIIKDKYTDEPLDAFRWDGQFYLSALNKNFKTDMFGSFKTMDIYQRCAVDSLFNNKITMIKGKPGSGKSVIGFNYAMHQLEKNKIDKIIFFVNPTLAKNAQALGFYTGDKDQKLLQSSVGNMLTSKFGNKSHVEAMIQREEIVLLPFGDIRGYDTTGMNALVYVIESQNLDKELLKLGIQRLGEDSKMIIDGDFHAQVDSRAYEGANNGMRRVSEVFRGESYYGEVELPIIYRSEMAKRAELM